MFWYKFNLVRAILDDVPNLHCGGCGISALAMLRWLKIHYPDKYRLAKVVTYHGYVNDSYTTNAEWKPGKEAQSASHVLLQLGHHIVDARVRIWSRKYYLSHRFTARIEGGEKAEMFLINSINNPHASWNTSFNREHVLTMQSKLGIDLNDVELVL